MSPALLGALRSLGLVLLAVTLHWFGDATNLTFISNPWIVTVLVTAALALEHQLESKTGKALFGMAKRRI